MGQPEALGFGVKWEGTAECQLFPRYSPLPLGLALTRPEPDPRADLTAGGGRKGETEVAAAPESYPLMRLSDLEAGHPGLLPSGFSSLPASVEEQAPPALLLQAGTQSSSSLPHH